MIRTAPSTGLASRFDQWLSDASADASFARELVALSASEWKQFLGAYGNERRADAARALIVRAYAVQARSPKDAVAVSRLAVAFAEGYVAPAMDEMEAALVLQADAWREHARSLLLTGDYDDARQAAEEAALHYTVVISEEMSGTLTLYGEVVGAFLSAITRGEAIPASRQEALEKTALLGLILGEILHHQGETDKGLEMIACCCEILLQVFDRKDKYVQGRTNYAKLLADAQRYADALEVLETTAVLARELGDTEVQAYLVGNIGVCYYYLGNPSKAKECAKISMQMLEDLELPLAAIRPRTLLVMILMKEGEENRARYSIAASELFSTRAAWLNAGMKTEAAYCMLRIVRALILARRQSHINWSEMNRTFTEAGLPQGAMRALHHVESIAASRTLELW